MDETDPVLMPIKGVSDGREQRQELLQRLLNESENDATETQITRESILEVLPATCMVVDCNVVDNTPRFLKLDAEPILVQLSGRRGDYFARDEERPPRQWTPGCVDGFWNFGLQEGLAEQAMATISCVIANLGDRLNFESILQEEGNVARCALLSDQTALLLMDAIEWSLNGMWKQDKMRIYGGSWLEPRLKVYFGSTPYSYHGVYHNPIAFPPLFAKVLDLMMAAGGASFNSMLVTMYRDQSDSIDWHADDEKCLGETPIIASLSLGASRDFVLRKNSSHKTRVAVHLAHGDYLIMRGATQKNWQHSIRKSNHDTGRRISITARFVSPDSHPASGPKVSKSKKCPTSVPSRSADPLPHPLEPCSFSSLTSSFSIVSPSLPVYTHAASSPESMRYNPLTQSDTIHARPLPATQQTSSPSPPSLPEFLPHTIAQVSSQSVADDESFHIPEASFAVKPKAVWGEIPNIPTGSIITGAHLLWSSSMHRHAMRGIGYSADMPAESVKLNAKANIGNTVFTDIAISIDDLLPCCCSDTPSASAVSTDSSSPSAKSGFHRWTRIDYIGEGRGADQRLVKGNKALIDSHCSHWPVRVVETVMGSGGNKYRYHGLYEVALVQKIRNAGHGYVEYHYVLIPWERRHASGWDATTHPHREGIDIDKFDKELVIIEKGPRLVQQPCEGIEGEEVIVEGVVAPIKEQPTGEERNSDGLSPEEEKKEQPTCEAQAQDQSSVVATQSKGKRRRLRKLQEKDTHEPAGITKKEEDKVKKRTRKRRRSDTDAIVQKEKLAPAKKKASRKRKSMDDAQKVTKEKKEKKKRKKRRTATEKKEEDPQTERYREFFDANKAKLQGSHQKNFMHLIEHVRKGTVRVRVDYLCRDPPRNSVDEGYGDLWNELGWENPGRESMHYHVWTRPAGFDAEAFLEALPSWLLPDTGTNSVPKEEKLKIQRPAPKRSRKRPETPTRNGGLSSSRPEEPLDARALRRTNRDNVKERDFDKKDAKLCMKISRRST